jgi:Ca2+-binding RTX toxin-like protein
VIQKGQISELERYLEATPTSRRDTFKSRLSSGVEANGTVPGAALAVRRGRQQTKGRMIKTTKATRILVVVAALLLLAGGIALAKEIRCKGGPCRGTSRADSIVGSVRRDVIVAKAGNDQVVAGRGSDEVRGGPGDDNILFGEDGNDKLLGGDGIDNLVGGAGRDSVFGGLGNDRLQGNDGDDKLTGDEGNDVILGGAGDDFIDAITGGFTDNADDIDCGDGVDKVFASTADKIAENCEQVGLP